MGIVENTYAELKQQELKNNPYSCLHMADIDINPHQVEAFTFALSSLELGGAILADEVGLGKTIEAGLVIKYLLCSGKNKILLIMPSNLRKQWQVELEEKFDIDSLIVDSSNWEDYLAKVKSKQAVIIVSYHFASKRKTEFGKIAWDFCVFDEAHRLRNVYKNGSKMANSLYELTKGIPKILLTATPMQNTLLDIYGLVQFIDDRVFYSKQIFSERYLRGEDYNDLKAYLEPVVQRTLRKEVAEYIQFSERKEMTIDFELSPMEIELYVMINNYLKKEILYALPNSHRTLITSVIRKLLASSSMAVAETFKVLKGRLETLKETTRTESADESIDFFLSFFDDDEIETDDDSKQDELYTREKVNEFIQHEIDEVTAIINKAESIKRNAKMTALKQAVETAFAFQDEAGIKQRIVVFTESIRTQQYMFEELSHAGYKGQILKFNGSTNDPVTKQIYKAWKARNYGKYVGSRNVELKNAIVEAFRDEYKILLVTDSGSEGLNLQFCNTIINYDLPWNPQKIEQRIGRCHRYGQKNDVVVINLLNTQNVADKRVYEILMSVVGQPKQNSEYIQATSRVGRQHPGIIFTVYNPYRPRDLSNYENFVGFHSQMYRYVEGTTATPFAARARDRVLHALVVSLLRLQVETMADNGGASNINDISDEQIKDIKDKILERVKITAPSSYVDTEKEMDEFINTWKNIAKGEKLYYFVPAVADDKKRLLTYYGEYYGDKEKPTLSSMRDVEQSSTVFYWEGV